MYEIAKNCFGLDVKRRVKDGLKVYLDCFPQLYVKVAPFWRSAIRHIGFNRQVCATVAPLVSQISQILAIVVLQ